MKLMVEHRIQISGILILIGLLIELISLHWSHPTAFLLFAIVGGLFLLTGILFYLYSLVTQREE
ncbi:hypothetical protein L0222_08035 [bacterium]|nr:hypothetical protein [bacterium]MCI0606492.1 hypothetical protein [bacterium]